MHVLYIGDRESDYSLYQGYLCSGSSSTFTLRWCATLTGAINFLRTNPIDVALLDLTPFADDGVEVVEQLYDCCPNLSIIVITGEGDSRAIPAYLEHVQDHLSKDEITPALLRRVLCYAYERKHVQERLRASEERYRLIVEDQAELICRFKPDYTLTFVNRAYSEQYRMRPEDMLGMNVLDMIPEEDRLAAHMHICRLTPEHPLAISEHRSLQPDGSVRWMQWQDRAIFDDAGKLVEVQGVGRDITDRRQAEDLLKFLFTLLESTNQAPDFHSALHATLRLICEHNGWIYGEAWLPAGEDDPVFVCPIYYAAAADADWVPTLRATTDAIRVSPDDGLLGEVMKTRSVHVIPDLRPLMDARLQRHKIALEVNLCSAVAAPILSSNQHPLAILLFASTEPISPDNYLIDLVAAAATHLEAILLRRQAEAAVRESNLLLERRVIERTTEMERAKKRAEAILNSSRDAIILADSNHRIQQTNAAFERLFKCSSPDAYFHKSLSQLVDEQSLSVLENALWQLRACTETPHIEVQARRSDGTTFDAEIGITPVLFPKEHSDSGSIVCILRDISTRKRAERTLNALLEEEREFQKYLKELHEITMELTQVDDFDAFCKQTVELGRERLGFERLALFLYDEERERARGMYGTDMNGNTSDERHLAFSPVPQGILTQSLQRSERFCYAENAQLSTGLESAGIGWNAAAVVWNGKQRLGWLVADNAISRTQASKPLLDVLALYSMTVGTLLARKRAEAALRESEKRLRVLFDNVPDGIALTGLDGRFVDVNPTILRWTGLTREQIIGKSMTDLDMFTPVDLSATQSDLAQTANGTSGHAEFELRRSDGSIVSLDVLTHPITVHGTPLILSIAHDITPRKQAEEELRNALQRERELHDLKSRFISTASHEFRTPLSTIQAAADTLEEFYDRMTEEERAMRFDKIREHIDHMTALLGDVLTIERIEADAQQIELETIALPEFLSALLDEFRDTYPDHILNCACQTYNLTVQADRKLLRQLITNLLSNAAKYSPQGSTVYCSLKQCGDRVHIEVRDEGIGIPEADRLHLFEPFFRAKNSNGIPGTGLGLAIASRAVKAHGGTLTCESEVGVGTRFIVELPLHPVSVRG